MITQDFLDKYVTARMIETIDYHRLLDYFMRHGFSKKHAKKMIRRGKKSVARHLRSIA